MDYYKKFDGVEKILDRINYAENIFLMGYFYLPLAILFLFFLWKVKNKIWKFIFFLIFSGFLLLFYGQFVERFWIKENFINLEKGWETRIVLISDQHLGVYKDQQYMKKVVEKINKIKNVDFILIAGDLTYWPQNIELEQSPLKDLKKPVFVALGNHDVVQSFGSFDSHGNRESISFKSDLEKILDNAGVKILYNKNALVKNSKGENISIFGLGSLYAHTDDVSYLKNANPEEQKTILLFHNPDTTLKKYPKNKDFSNSVTFAGHTHCGQVRIPFLYKYALSGMAGEFYDNGPYDLEEKGTMVVTCGLGESLIPIRLFNRPEITVVDL